MLDTSSSCIVTLEVAALQKERVYLFEEDLPHHIREALVIISTGTTMSFFANPYVTDWLRGLDPAHRPIYRQKFLRLLRVILFILVSVCLQVMHCDVSVAVTDIIILVF